MTALQAACACQALRTLIDNRRDLAQIAGRDLVSCPLDAHMAAQFSAALEDAVLYLAPELCEPPETELRWEPPDHPGAGLPALTPAPRRAHTHASREYPTGPGASLPPSHARRSGDRP